MPWGKLGFTYVTVLAVTNIANLTYSLALEDYCKRDSQIYDVKERNTRVLRKLIKETNDKEKLTIKGKSMTTLTEEEVIEEE